ncbi:oxidoreductase, partial [Pyxidicoccus fallax]|nr:oxidoreductase [Pyxidicoccus fallax]
MKEAERALPPPDETPLPTALSLDEVRRCIRLLEAMGQNRLLLAELPAQEKIALLSAAGRVVHPDRDTKSRLAKSLRRERKQAVQKHDRTLRATTEIRT